MAQAKDESKKDESVAGLGLNEFLGVDAAIGHDGTL